MDSAAGSKAEEAYDDSEIQMHSFSSIPEGVSKGAINKKGVPPPLLAATSSKGGLGESSTNSEDYQFLGSVLEIVGISTLIVMVWILLLLPIIFYHLPVGVKSSVSYNNITS